MEQTDEKSGIVRAVELKRSGKYNCAQAVLCAYAGAAGIDEPTAMAMAASFGTGMGNLQGTCGALVGAGMVLGMVHRDRVASMKAMARVMTKFQERNTTVVCHELKGLATRCPLRACNDCVADAAEFLESEL